MRKTMWLPLAVLTVLCVAGAPATASKGRAAKATYSFDMTKGGSIWVNDEDVGITSGSSIPFETKRADKTVALMVMDDSAEAVSAAVWQEGTPATIFCHETASIPITGGQPVYVQVILDVSPAGTGGCETPEVPTTGTISAVFGSGAMKHGAHHHHHH